MRQAIVVLGAVASHDCVSENVSSHEEFVPRLVTGLFGRRFEEILHAYPPAAQLAASIRVATSSGQVALEAYLRDELLNSEHEHLRRKVPAIPLYLQHLLFEVSRSYTPQPDNYDRLILEALRLDKVTFITLNYDTLLDQRLAIDAPIEEMRDYIHVGRKWALVKLHGSVNWGQPVTNELDETPTSYGYDIRPAGQPPKTFASYYARLGEAIETDRETVLRPEGSLEDALGVDLGRSRSLSVTGRMQYGDLYYPALAVPLGEADEVVCPDDHVEHLREHQRHAPGGPNILVIGYSGFDNEVRELLAWGGRPLSSLLVVNGKPETNLAAAEKIAGALGSPVHESMAFPGGFNDFAQSDSLIRYFRSLQDTGD